MLRRQGSVTKVAAVALASLHASIRSAHHKPTTHDWAPIWTHTPSAEESVAIKNQAFRPVSAVVPGEMFMRHWIAAEQSTVSVVNRVISGMIIVVCLVWASGFATLGYNSHSCAHTAGWFFLAAFYILLESHNLLLGALLAVGAGVQLLQ